MLRQVFVLYSVSLFSTSGFAIAAEQKKEYTYDALGRVTNIQEDRGTAADTSDDLVILYQYDANGNRTSFSLTDSTIAQFSVIDQQGGALAMVADPPGTGMWAEDLTKWSITGDELGLPGSGPMTGAAYTVTNGKPDGGLTRNGLAGALTYTNIYVNVSEILGTPFADTFQGLSHDETFRGGDGDDMARGRGGADTLYGDAGADELFGGSGDDHLYGGPGDDRLDGQEGTDTVHFAASGSYSATQQAGYVEATGPEGTDRLYDVEFVQLGAGPAITIADFIANGLGDGGSGGPFAVVDQQSGALAMVADPPGTGMWAENLTKWSITGDELGLTARGPMTGGAYTVTNGRPNNGLTRNGVASALTYTNIYVNASEILGTPFADTFQGLSHDETFRGGDGDDTANGRIGADTLYGDAGADELIGGDGDDHLYGGPGDDRLYGDAGTDTVHFAASGSYSATQQAGYVEATGPEGTDRLYDVEFVQLGAGPAITIADFIANGLGGGGSGGPQNDIRLRLVDADTDQIIRLLSPTDTISASELTAGNYSFDAVYMLSGSVGSIRFFEGGVFVHNENIAPFARFGDDQAGDYYGAPLPSGSFTLTVRVYSEIYGGGMLLEEQDYSFTVTP